MNTDKKKFSFVKTILRIVPLSYKATPWHNISSNLMGIVHGASFALSIIATQQLFDVIIDAAEGRAEFWDCLLPLIILAVITFGQHIMNGVHNFHFGVMSTKSAGVMTTILQKKLQRIDPSQFEDTEFLDDINKAREGSQVISYMSMTLSIFVFFYGAYFAVICAY